MPVQKQDLRKNYIGVLREEIDEQSAAAELANSRHPMKAILRALIANVLIRRGAPNAR